VTVAAMPMKNQLASPTRRYQSGILQREVEVVCSSSASLMGCPPFVGVRMRE
jgi:hypothetical protein